MVFYVSYIFLELLKCLCGSTFFWCLGVSIILNVSNFDTSSCKSIFIIHLFFLDFWISKNICAFLSSFRPVWINAPFRLPDFTQAIPTSSHSIGTNCKIWINWKRRDFFLWRAVFILRSVNAVSMCSIHHSCLVESHVRWLQAVKAVEKAVAERETCGPP